MIIPVTIGKGGGTAFGYVVANFPTTTTSCTCSSGETVLQADEAALAKGLYVFAIPSAGTWTVTAISGALSNTQNVSITAEGQAESVNISFWDGTLYNAGDQYTDITGGWEKVGKTGAVTFNDTNINLTATSEYANPTVSTVNPIDLSSFTTLSAVISGASATYHDTRRYKGILKAVTLNPAGTESVAASTSLTTAPSGSVFPQTDLDVSALTGECYIRIVTQYIGGTTNIMPNIFIHNVWLE